MEKQEQPRPQASPSHRHGRNNPSFSSSLLDAIYRSIDDSDTSTPCLAPSSADPTRALPPPPPTTLRRTHDLTDNRRHRRFFSATISSDCSPRFGGFSSSDFDFTTRPRPVLTRSKLIPTNSLPPPEKKRSGRSISRIRDLQKSPASASPGARFASFLNAIFASGVSGSPNKPKFAGGVEKPATCSKSSYSRSGNNKAAPSYKGVEDLRPTRPCGGRDTATARDRRRMVELFGGLEDQEDQEDLESVSSSDLFELESLSLIGRFADELPVYETTNLGKNCAIARGFVV